MYLQHTRATSILYKHRIERGKLTSKYSGSLTLEGSRDQRDALVI